MQTFGAKSQKFSKIFRISEFCKIEISQHFKDTKMAITRSIFRYNTICVSPTLSDLPLIVFLPNSKFSFCLLENWNVPITSLAALYCNFFRSENSLCMIVVKYHHYPGQAQRPSIVREGFKN